MKDFSPLAITDAIVGFPARVGVITRTDGTVVRFSEADEAIVVGGDTFPVVGGLQVSAIKHTNNGQTPSCQIVGGHNSVDATFITAAIEAGLYDGATVQIYNVDRLDLSTKGLWFTGAIANISYDTDNRVMFDVKGPSISAKRLLTQKRSPMCRTDWGSDLCGANPASFAVAATVLTVVDAFTFTVSGLVNPDGYFNQGVAVTGGGVSFEVANWVQSTQRLTSYLVSDRIVEAGTTLTLYPGCNKTLTGANGCAAFGRQLSFQGEPHFQGTAAAAQQV